MLFLLLYSMREGLSSMESRNEERKKSELPHLRQELAHVLKQMQDYTGANTDDAWEALTARYQELEKQIQTLKEKEGQKTVNKPTPPPRTPSFFDRLIGRK